MPRPTKYIMGPRILNMNGLISAVFGGDYIYLFHKPQHPAVVKNMTVATLEGYIRRKHAYYTLPNPLLEKK